MQQKHQKQQKPQNSTNLNKKRRLCELFSVKTEFTDTQEQKKKVSNRGRKAKVSLYIKEEDEKIKEQSKQLALLEQCLYLSHGGATSVHTSRTLRRACELIKQTFGDKYAIEFKDMEMHSKELLINDFDPIVFKLNPLSDLYFMDRHMKKGEKEFDGSIDFKSFLVIFLYQIYKRSGEIQFKDIVQMLKQVYDECQTYETQGHKQKVGIHSSLEPTIIFSLINISQSMQIVYSYLYPLMKEMFSYFASKIGEKFIIIKY